MAKASAATLRSDTGPGSRVRALAVVVGTEYGGQVARGHDGGPNDPSGDMGAARRGPG
ncbi:hypothetical protein [Streptomyces europaeiscabiei]|uniref:hypothetical protein n=1 Tax=Streptomyces europaeiscabiei TaxID=146819 RepID=UPI0038F67526